MKNFEATPEFLEGIDTNKIDIEFMRNNFVFSINLPDWNVSEYTDENEMEFALYANKYLKDFAIKKFNEYGGWNTQVTKIAPRTPVENELVEYTFLHNNNNIRYIFNNQQYKKEIENYGHMWGVMVTIGKYLSDLSLLWDRIFDEFCDEYYNNI